MIPSWARESEGFGDERDGFGFDGCGEGWRSGYGFAHFDGDGHGGEEYGWLLLGEVADTGAGHGSTIGQPGGDGERGAGPMGGGIGRPARDLSDGDGGGRLLGRHTGDGESLVGGPWRWR